MTDNQIERAIMALGRDLHGMGDAEAVFRSWFNKSPEKREVERQVRLVLEAAAPAIPEGWVMVPVEPTEAMLAKGHHMIDWWRTDQPTNTNDNPLQKPGGVGTNCKEDLQDAWRAMIDARPLPTEEEGTNG